MKKRIAAAICTAMLLAAPMAHAASYTAKDGGALFTLRYDEQKYALDQYSYLNTSLNGTWFFMLYDAQHSVDCGMEYGDRGTASLQEYAQAVCAATGGTLLEIYQTAKQSFVIVHCQRPEGSSYYAETIIGGNIVYFEMFDMSSGQTHASCLADFKAILDNVTPLQ